MSAEKSRGDEQEPRGTPASMGLVVMKMQCR